MYKKLTMLALCLMSLSCYAQVGYEKGYFINNSGERTDCLIRNTDWENNPTQFKYKLSDGGEIYKAKIDSVTEFSIDGFSKYIRAQVEIDRSSDDLGDFSYERNPEFSEETLFLKMLVHGKASLYYFKDRSIKRFFFNTDEVQLQQLVYKQYYLSNKGDQRYSQTSFATNNQYKQQLLNYLKCDGLSKYKTQNIIRELCLSCFRSTTTVME